MNQAALQKKKREIFEIIQIGSPTNNSKSYQFDVFLSVVIVLNIIVLFLQTFEELSFMEPVLRAIEIFTIIIFIIEYVLRLWTSDLLYPEKSKIDAALTFIFSMDGIIELCTILPFFFLSGFVVFRMLRVVRIFRLFRINNSLDSFNVITSVIYEKRSQLACSFFIIFVLMLASSLSLYSVEHDAQPEAFRNALSGIWWSVSALLTVGYGDIYPITLVGKTLGILISFLGVCAVAIPTGIISAGFVEQIRKSEIDPDSLDTYVSTIIIDVDSKWLNQTVQQIEEDTDYQLAVIKRDDMILKPSPDLVICLKDAILAFENKEHRNRQ
ncbi:MAG: ion transporter [Solobacterium sp.]|nr:ion transporter [Solobacterium sp.]